MLLCIGGKIEQRIQTAARKRLRGTGLSKQLCPALTSSMESYAKHLKGKPPKTMQETKWKTETRQGWYISYFF